MKELFKHAVGPVQFTYTNWKGETRLRRALFESYYFGTTEYHKEPQWLVEGYDYDKKATRVYAMRDMQDVQLLTDSD